MHFHLIRVWGHVPLAVKKAFERAHSVFFELDLTDPETVAQLATCQMLPEGKTRTSVNMYYHTAVLRQNSQFRCTHFVWYV